VFTRDDNLLWTRSHSGPWLVLSAHDIWYQEATALADADRDPRVRLPSVNFLGIYLVFVYGHSGLSSWYRAFTYRWG